MKKVIAIFLLLTLVLAACGEQGPTSYGDKFVHETPAEMQGHQKILLQRDDYADYMESILNVNAYPDLLMYDEVTKVLVGMYIYDPETGLATGWTNLETGVQTMYEPGKEVNLGKPGEEDMVKLEGTVKLGFAVYEKDNKATGAELYFFLSDKDDAQQLKDFLRENYGETLTKVSDKIYKIDKDAATVEADFNKEEKAGLAYFNRNGEDYAAILRINYGVKPVE